MKQAVYSSANDLHDMSKKTYLYYYEISREGFVYLNTNDNQKIPNTSAVNFRRLVYGTNESPLISEIALADPFTVTVNGQVVFRLKSKKWIAKIMQWQMTKQ